MAVTPPRELGTFWLSCQSPEVRCERNVALAESTASAKSHLMAARSKSMGLPRTPVEDVGPGVRDSTMCAHCLAMSHVTDL